MDRMYIDWKKYYGKKFKLVYTPKGKQTGKWEKGQISIVTPKNGEAWEEWPEVSREDYLRFKNNWHIIQKNLSKDKYNQIVEQKLLFYNTVRLIVEGLQNVNEIADRFCGEFLSNYERDEKGTFNCAWVTQQFIKWAKKNGINAKAIYMVWPDKPDGEAHIAPVVNNQILDFTIHQFDKSVKECYKITPVKDWKRVYGPYGYGVNYVDVDGKKQTVMVNTFDYFNNSTALGAETGKAGLTIYPAKLKRQV